MGILRRLRLRELLLKALPIGALWLAGCAAAEHGVAGGSFEPATPGVLRVVTAVVPTPGFWEGTPERVTGGYERELAQRLADRLDLDRVEVETTSFSRIVTGDLGGADLALALLTPTDERDEVLDFSDPYFVVPPAVLARADLRVRDLQTARALRWVVVQNTTLQDIVADTIDPQTDPVVVPNRNAAVREVLAGRGDAVLFDLPLAVAYAEGSRGALAVSSKLQTAEPIAAALPDGSDNVEAVSAAIRAFRADGTLDDLAERWLAPAARRNGASIPFLRSSRR